MQTDAVPELPRFCPAVMAAHQGVRQNSRAGAARGVSPQLRRSNRGVPMRGLATFRRSSNCHEHAASCRCCGPLHFQPVWALASFEHHTPTPCRLARRRRGAQSPPAVSPSVEAGALESRRPPTKLRRAHHLLRWLPPRPPPAPRLAKRKWISSRKFGTGAPGPKSGAPRNGRSGLGYGLHHRIRRK